MPDLNYTGFLVEQADLKKVSEVNLMRYDGKGTHFLFAFHYVLNLHVQKLP